MKIIQGSSVYSEEHVGSVRVKKRLGWHKRIASAADKSTILADGSDTATISFTWQIFDVEQDKYIDNPEETTEIEVVVGSYREKLIPTNGVATLQFTSAEPGTYIIETVNDRAENTSIEVVAEIG